MPPFHFLLECSRGYLVIACHMAVTHTHTLTHTPTKWDELIPSTESESTTRCPHLHSLPATDQATGCIAQAVQR